MLYKYIDQALSDLYRELVPTLLDIIGQILRLFNVKLLLTYILWIAYAGVVVALWLTEQDTILNAAWIIACVGMLGWGILALVETDLRRFLAFAITSQLGFVRFVLLGATISWTAALTYFITAGTAVQPEVVVIVDAAELGDTLGAMAIVEANKLAGATLSTHKASLSLFIMALRFEVQADIFLLGVQPASIAFGAPMNPAVATTLRLLEDMFQSCWSRSTNAPTL
jgi:hydrogenase maturation protease